MAEEWRAVVGYEGTYEVSDQGRIRSLTFRNKQSERPRLLILAARSDAGGHLRVSLWRDNAQQDLYVHRLVLLAFVGVGAADQEGAHLDGNPRNNVPANLAWVSHQENCSHQQRHGTSPVGERNPSAKLKASTVIRIRALTRQGVSRREITRIFGLSRTTTDHIVSRRRWAHV